MGNRQFLAWCELQGLFFGSIHVDFPYSFTLFPQANALKVFSLRFNGVALLISRALS